MNSAFFRQEMKSAGDCPTEPPPRIMTDKHGNAVTDENGVVQTHAPGYQPYIGDDGGKGSPGLGTYGFSSGFIWVILRVYLDYIFI